MLAGNAAMADMTGDAGGDGEGLVRAGYCGRQQARRAPLRQLVHRGLLCCALAVRRQRAACGYWTGPISALASSA